MPENLTYSRKEYVDALHYFGYKRARAEIIVENRINTGTLWKLDYLMNEYNRHRKEP